MLRLHLFILSPCFLLSSKPKCICITWEQQHAQLPEGLPCHPELKGQPSTAVLLEILFHFAVETPQEWAGSAKTADITNTSTERYRVLTSEVERLATFKYMKAYFGVHWCASVCSASLPCAQEKLKRRDQKQTWMLVFDVNHNSNPHLHDITAGCGCPV